MAKLPGKTVAESAAEMVEVVLPDDANPLGNMLGGRVMHLIDIAGAISAHRHARSQVVTVAVDNLDFLYPIRVGELVVLRACITRAFRTSMEAEVRVYREDYLTGKRQQTSSAFVTYVALDAAGKPREVPPLIPHSEEENRVIARRAEGGGDALPLPREPIDATLRSLSKRTHPAAIRGSRRS